MSSSIGVVVLDGSRQVGAAASRGRGGSGRDSDGSDGSATAVTAQRVVPACVGALATMTPLDVVRVRAQTDPRWMQRATHGTLASLVSIGRGEGMRALWKGLSATVALSVPSTALYMVGYEASRDALAASTWSFATASAYAPAVSGVGARVMVVLLFAPIEIVRTRLQQTQVGAVSAIAAPPAAAPLANSPTSAFGVARALYTDGGVRSFWRGLVPTLYRDIPFSATYWFTYENMRVALQQRWAAQLTDATAYSDDVPISNANRMVSSFVSGAVAGSLAAIITTPLDLAKSRRQMSIGSGATVDAHFATTNAETSVWRILQLIYRDHGVRGLMTGLGARLLKVAPSCAIMITTYEVGKAYMSGS